MSFAGPVVTTRVNLSMDGRSSHSEIWMVLDVGHTLSPNSALLPPVSSPKPRHRLDAVTNRPAVVRKEGPQI
jgi:hypothetical protein